MTDLDKAIRVLDGQGAYCGQCSREPGDPLDDCRDCAAGLKMYAQALKEAGLLMPDLPKPDSHDEYGWPIYGETEYKTYFSKHPCKGIPYITCPLGEWLSADMVREEAYRLLAAAEWLDNWDKEHAEKEQDNE